MLFSTDALTGIACVLTPLFLCSVRWTDRASPTTRWLFHADHGVCVCACVCMCVCVWLPVRGRSGPLALLIMLVTDRLTRRDGCPSVSARRFYSPRRSPALLCVLTHRRTLHVRMDRLGHKVLTPFGGGRGGTGGVVGRDEEVRVRVGRARAQEIGANCKRGADSPLPN